MKLTPRQKLTIYRKTLERYRAEGSPRLEVQERLVAWLEGIVEKEGVKK